MIDHPAGERKSGSDALDAYLALEKSRPFEWSGEGNGDCHLFVLGWIETIKPRLSLQCDALRGRYRSESEARMHLESLGGSISVGCELMGPPRMASPPVRGDVGLIAYESWHFGLICTGRMWVFRHPLRGLKYTIGAPEICWSTGFR